jgi:hypothetical protein
MAPPEYTTLPNGSTTTFGNLHLPPKPVITGASLSNIDAVLSSFELEGSAPQSTIVNAENRLETMPHRLYHFAELAAFTKDSTNTHTNDISAKSGQPLKAEDNKAEKDTSKPVPTFVTTPPALAEKIMLAREFGNVLDVPEREAYQALMAHHWDVDEAVLAYMSYREIGGK